MVFFKQLENTISEGWNLLRGNVKKLVPKDSNPNLTFRNIILHLTSNIQHYIHLIVVMQENKVKIYMKTKMLHAKFKIIWYTDLTLFTKIIPNGS